MNTGLIHSRFASAALLVALVGLGGCIDPKTIGLETDDESGAVDTAGSTEGETQPTTGVETEGETQPTSAGTDTGGEPCPPIEIADCVTCECIEGNWACDSSACNYDCSDDPCGEPCMACLLGDPECEAPEYEGTCMANGACVAGGGACTQALQPGFEASLTESEGCIDMLVVASDPAHTEGLVLMVSGDLVMTAADAGTVTFTELTVGDPSLDLQAVAGVGVTQQACQDVVVPGIEVHEVWNPTSGTVGITIEPIAGTIEGYATLELTNVVFEREQPGADPITVPSLVIPDVYVGWFPG